MAFYLEYLRQEAFPNTRDDLLLLDPSTAFMMTSLPAESVPMLLEPLQASSKLMVVIPINNNTDAAAAGGSHWSLLCYLRAAPAGAAAAAQACCARGDIATAAAEPPATEGRSHGGGEGDSAGEDMARAVAFVHVDSCAGGNSAAVARAIPAARHLVGDLRAPLHSARSPQQQNCYDCGMYALEAAERLGRLAAAIAVGIEADAGPRVSAPTATAAEGRAGSAADACAGARGAGALLCAVEAVLGGITQRAVTAKRGAIMELVRERGDPAAQLP